MHVGKITGFKNNNLSSPIIILDFRGVPFYDTSIIDQPVKYFNMPAGQYIIQSGNFSELENPVKYHKSKLPPPERDTGKRASTFEIAFANNPNKCTVFWDEEIIVFDPLMLELPIPYLQFILCHEWAHKLYESEHLADTLAASLMKEKGFNPSQIGYAILDTLSDRQFHRKKHLVENLNYEYEIT